VALFGAAPGIAEAAANRLATLCPQHRFDVIGHGFLQPAQRKAAFDELKSRPADILLVALGNPRQEFCIADEIDAGHARVAIGVGALFDFLAGKVPRAPATMRRLRFEWLFRLAIEPRRLFKRYVIGNPAFVLRVLRERRMKRSPAE
jgi:exopolysaccharide biosynthesis WecB/TagA/CpsF family protein